MASNATDLIAARITGERWLNKRTAAGEHPTHGAICRLAYHFYELRGRREGGAMADWLLAERELIHHHGCGPAERAALAPETKQQDMAPPEERT
jgi:hypothetical protein